MRSERKSEAPSGYETLDMFSFVRSELFSPTAGPLNRHLPVKKCFMRGEFGNLAFCTVAFSMLMVFNCVAFLTNALMSCQSQSPSMSYH